MSEGVRKLFVSLIMKFLKDLLHRADFIQSVFGEILTSLYPPTIKPTCHIASSPRKLRLLVVL